MARLEAQLLAAAIATSLRVFSRTLRETKVEYLLARLMERIGQGTVATERRFPYH